MPLVFLKDTGGYFFLKIYLPKIVIYENFLLTKCKCNDIIDFNIPKW